MEDQQTVPESQPDLELILDSDSVGLSQMVSAASTFAQLIGEIAKAYAGSDRDPVAWIVDVKPGSVRLSLRGQPASKQLKPSAVHQIAGAITHGLKALDQRPERPPYFTDRAVVLSRALANLASEELPIAVRNGGAKTPLTKRVLAHADALLGPVLTSYGTVEGRLEALSIHGPRSTFAIYEPLTDHRVDCYFGRGIELADITAAVGKRVGARGIIKTKRSGERISVEVEELRVLRDNDELPPAREARGVLRAAG